MTSDPSVDLGRSRSVGQILRSTLALYTAYPWLFLVLAAAVMAPWDLVKLLITGHGPLGHAHHESFVEAQSLQLFDLVLIGPLIPALHAQAVVVIGDGVRPRLGSVASKGMRALPVVAIAAGLAGIAIEIGFFALLIPGILLWVRFSVVAQAAAIEQQGIRAAWRRSRQLARNHERHIFGLLLAIGLLTVGVVLGAFALTTGGATSPGAVALGIAIDTVLASLTALATALLYFDLLARQTEAPAVVPMTA
jgi:hypothetical protein